MKSIDRHYYARRPQLYTGGALIGIALIVYSIVNAALTNSLGALGTAIAGVAVITVTALIGLVDFAYWLWRLRKRPSGTGKNV
jgi:hypothetical protein